MRYLVFIMLTWVVFALVASKSEAAEKDVYTCAGYKLSLDKEKYLKDAVLQMHILIPEKTWNDREDLFMLVAHKFNTTANEVFMDVDAFTMRIYHKECKSHPKKKENIVGKMIEHTISATKRKMDELEPWEVKKLAELKIKKGD